MNWLVIAYTTIYGALSVAGVWSDFKSQYAGWIIVVDTLSSLYGLLGMILLLMSYSSPSVLQIMQFGYPIFVFCSLFVATIDVIDEWKNDPEDRKTTIIGSAIALLIQLPAFFLCYSYAFG